MSCAYQPKFNPYCTVDVSKRPLVLFLCGARGVPPCRGPRSNLIHCMTAQNRHPHVENRVQAHGPGVRRLPKAEVRHKGQCVAQRYTDTESSDSHATGAAAATGFESHFVCVAYIVDRHTSQRRSFEGSDGRGEVLFIATQFSLVTSSAH